MVRLSGGDAAGDSISSAAGWIQERPIIEEFGGDLKCGLRRSVEGSHEGTKTRRDCARDFVALCEALTLTLSPDGERGLLRAVVNTRCRLRACSVRAGFAFGLAGRLCCRFATSRDLPHRVARKARGPAEASLTSAARDLGFSCEFIVDGIRRARPARDAPLNGFRPAEMVPARGTLSRAQMSASLISRAGQRGRSGGLSAFGDLFFLSFSRGATGTSRPEGGVSCNRNRF